jgi:hypothetical protein
MRAMTTLMTTLAVLVLAGGAADAKTIRFACNDGYSMVYDSEDQGTVTLHAPYGEASLPASKEERDGMFGIRASGATKLTMPDKAAVEACVIAKAKGQTDTDVILFYTNSCGQTVAPGAAPVDVKAEV